MAGSFAGIVNVDVRDSEADWAPLGAFAIAGAGLYVGRDPGEALTKDYPGVPPFAFTGGTIDRVAIDVSGEPYVDMESEAALILMRE